MKRVITFCLAVLLATSVLAAIGNHTAVSAEEPKRGMALTSDYTSIVTGRDQDISLDVILANTGKIDEDIDLSISGPDGWITRLSDWSGSIVVRGSRVGAEKSVSLKFQCKPPSDVKESDYAFTIDAVTKDKKLSSSLKLSIGITGKPVPKATLLVLTSDAPTLRGPSGTNFAFKVTMKNNDTVDRTFDLGVQLPTGWNASFSPGWEKERLISARLVKAGTSEDINVALTLPRDVKAGEFPLTFQARSGDLRGTIDLKVEITATYELILNTMTGLLNTKATAGQTTHVASYIASNGSGAISSITFLSDKPDGWEITFDPKEISSLASQTIREVDVAIKPAAKAIAGDYSITLRASGDQGFDSIELRVTVETPTTWGWVGIGIVVLVILALGAIFVSLKRR